MSEATWVLLWAAFMTAWFVLWAGWKLLSPLAREVWRYNVEIRRAQRRSDDENDHTTTTRGGN